MPNSKKMGFKSANTEYVKLLDDCADNLGTIELLLQCALDREMDIYEMRLMLDVILSTVRNSPLWTDRLDIEQQITAKHLKHEQGQQVA